MALDWCAGVPVSRQFADPYYSRHGGWEESQHVFLSGNHLPARVQAAQAPLTVIELGFGTGLNIFALWDLACRVNRSVRCISVEKYPLTADEIARAMTAFPPLAPLVRDFLPWYAGGRAQPLRHPHLTLDLRVGDVALQLAQVTDIADAWFLDGFAPAKNPDMWSEAVINHIARLSRSGTTFATFTAAGVVRRRLIAAGFIVEKVPGFAYKREMLAGYRQ